MNKRYDSLIFDMDGTLWDAVDSYCKIWDVTLEQMSVKRRNVRRSELIALMGKPIDRIYDSIVGDGADRHRFLSQLDENERTMMPELGGRLYPGVYETIPSLALDYRLFMASNCGADGLHNFLRYTQLEPYFTGTITHGETHQDKDLNILALIKRYDLKRPLYVGDTQGDLDSCRKAGVPVAWVSYGFGVMEAPDYTIDSFSELAYKIRYNQPPHTIS